MISSDDQLGGMKTRNVEIVFSVFRRSISENPACERVFQDRPIHERLISISRAVSCKRVRLYSDYSGGLQSDNVCVLCLIRLLELVISVSETLDEWFSQWRSKGEAEGRIAPSAPISAREGDAIFRIDNQKKMKETELP